jgi:hypothetical protein
MITSQFLMAKSNSQLNIGGQPFLDQFSQEICTTQFHTTAERLPAVVNPTLSTSAQSGESCPPEICEVTAIGWAPPHSTQHTPPIVAGKIMHASHQWHSFAWTQGVYTPNLMVYLVYLSCSLLTLQFRVFRVIFGQIMTNPSHIVRRTYPILSYHTCHCLHMFFCAIFLRISHRNMDEPNIRTAHCVNFLTLDEANIRTSLV